MVIIQHVYKIKNAHSVGVSRLTVAQLVTTMQDMVTITAETVANNVKYALEESGLTLSETAEKTGIPRTTLTRRLKSANTSPFDVSELLRLSKVTKYSIEDFFKHKQAAIASKEKSQPCLPG